MDWNALVLTCRTCQPVQGIILMSMFLAIDYTEDWAGDPFIEASIASCVMLILVGCIGIFAFKRPQMVNWYLMLGLDILGLTASLYVCIIFTLFIAYGAATDCTWDPGAYGNICGELIATPILAYPLLFATLFSLVWTCRSRKKGNKLPPGTAREDWIQLEEHGPSKL